MHKVKQHAFTLIELLVVISVIAVLMAILMPALRAAKNQARTTICLSNLRQWSTVFTMYTSDFDGSFNEGWMGGAEKSNWWMDAGRKYYGDVDEIRCCPTATNPITGLDGLTGPGADRQPFAAWGYNPGFFKEKTDFGSYGANGWLENKPADGTTTERGRKFWRKAFNLKDPSNVPMMTDMQWIDAWPEPHHGPPAQENSKWQNQSSMVRVVQNRHKARQGMAFGDGSVSLVGLKELWTFRWHKEYNIKGQWTLAGGATQDRWPEWMRSFTEY